MDSQKLPNDVLQEIIGLLAQQTQRGEVRNFLGLSSFCREQANRHIFSTIDLGCKTKKSTTQFVSLFSGKDAPTSYVRALFIHITISDWTDQVVQAGLYNILPRLHNLTSLYIFTSSESEWMTLPPISIRSAIRHLPLLDLTLRMVHKFSIEELSSLPKLTRLSLSRSILCQGDTSNVRAHSETLGSCNLEALQIRNFSSATFLKDIIKPLLARDDRQRFLLPLANLKSFDVDFSSFTDFENVIDLMGQHCINRLQDLSLGLNMEHNDTTSTDCSQWIDQIVLPQRSTLMKLKIENQISTYGHDPYAGFSSTLAQLGEDNIVESITIEVLVGNYCCTTSEKWHALTEVLTKGSWKQLREVKVSVSVLVYPAWHDPALYRLRTELNDLRDTHLKPLFTQKFEFVFEVD